jgi:hypothetical protein
MFRPHLIPVQAAPGALLAETALETEEYGEQLKIKIGNLIYFVKPSIKQLTFC